jgi:hypothetical protein
MKPTSFQTKAFWNEAHILPEEGLLKRRLSTMFLVVWHSWSFLRFHLKWSLRPSKQRSFETKPTSFQTKVFWNEAYVLSDVGLLKWRLRPFEWRLSPMFLGVWHSWSFVHFLLKRNPRPSIWRCFEMKLMSFRTTIYCNEIHILPYEGVLKWSSCPSGWQSIATKPTSFRTKVFWNEDYVLSDEC